MWAKCVAYSTSGKLTPIIEWVIGACLNRKCNVFFMVISTARTPIRCSGFSLLYDGNLRIKAVYMSYISFMIADLCRPRSNLQCPFFGNIFPVFMRKKKPELLLLLLFLCARRRALLRVDSTVADFHVFVYIYSGHLISSLYSHARSYVGFLVIMLFWSSTQVLIDNRLF